MHFHKSYAKLWVIHSYHYPLAPYYSLTISQTIVTHNKFPFQQLLIPILVKFPSLISLMTITIPFLTNLMQSQHRPHPLTISPMKHFNYGIWKPIMHSISHHIFSSHNLTLESFPILNLCNFLILTLCQRFHNALAWLTKPNRVSSPHRPHNNTVSNYIALVSGGKQGAARRCIDFWVKLRIFLHMRKSQKYPKMHSFVLFFHNSSGNCTYNAT